MAVAADRRRLYAAAREARLWASEAIAKAADAAADDNVQSFQGYMAEAGRLALVSAKRTKEARALG